MGAKKALSVRMLKALCLLWSCGLVCFQLFDSWHPARKRGVYHTPLGVGLPRAGALPTHKHDSVNHAAKEYVSYKAGVSVHGPLDGPP